MKIKHYLKIIILPLFLIANSLNLFAQQNKENLLYNWFDETTGKNNSVIYNGNLYHYNYKTPNDSIHCFYKKNDFVKGMINSENKQYYDVNLKYDIYNDLLVSKPEGKYESNQIQLISEKIDFFTLDKKKFVNLNIVKADKPNYVKGFYEEINYAKDLTLYIKHYKTIRQIDINDIIRTDFTLRNDFLVLSNSTFKKINNKKDITSLFPENKKQINDYYIKNKIAEKQNKIEFIKNLIGYINSIKTN